MAAEVITPSTPPPTLNKGIPIAAIIDLIENKGLTIPQTAKLLGCDRSNVSKRLKTVGLQPGYLDKYKDLKADILAFQQMQILDSITPEDRKKAGLSQKAVAYGVFYDKERLERDKSTVNIAYADMVKAKEIVDARIAEREEKWKASGGQGAK